MWAFSLARQFVTEFVSNENINCVVYDKNNSPHSVDSSKNRDHFIFIVTIKIVVLTSYIHFEPVGSKPFPIYK
jgi:hypothetical protein